MTKINQEKDTIDNKVTGSLKDLGRNAGGDGSIDIDYETMKPTDQEEMIKSILQPRFHGNGFIQIYLNEVSRMHIWSPKFPAIRVQNAQIHDHRFWFTSSILIGELRHIEHTVIMTREGYHGMYQADHASKVARLTKVGNCTLGKQRTFYHKAGTCYDFGGPGRFHESDASELTVTVITKTKVQKGYAARMVSFNDEPPDHAFENQPDFDDMVKEVRRVMSILLGGGHGL